MTKYLYILLIHLLHHVSAFGYGLSNSSFSLALNSFFTKRLNKASGIAMTMAGIGPIIYPPLMNWLLHMYGVNGCMLIIGAIAFHMLVAAVLLQPLERHMVRDKTSVLPFQQTFSFPHIIPNVSTFLSIGRFSESSCTFAVCENSNQNIFPSFFQMVFFSRYLNFSCSKQWSTVSICIY